MESRLIRQAIVLGILALVGCATGSQSIGYQRILDEDVFRSRVVDRPLSWPGGFDVRFTPDGLIQGRFPQGKVEGTWQWNNGEFCRTISVSGASRTPECLGIELDDSRVRFRRQNGGYFLPYNIGPSG